MRSLESHTTSGMGAVVGLILEPKKWYGQFVNLKFYHAQEFLCEAYGQLLSECARINDRRSVVLRILYNTG